jgi:hypothetical protein
VSGSTAERWRRLVKVTVMACLWGGLYVTEDAMAQSTVCRALLWPRSSAVNDPSFTVPPELLMQLKRIANPLLSKHAHPMLTLGSSGKVNRRDPLLLASREAFKDADRAAVLALTYRLTHDTRYLDCVRDGLIQWATLNHPTGNPIDETRLDGFIWAYDLVSCDLSEQERRVVLRWFQAMRFKKIAWNFGHVTTSNNYRIHQIKMLILLDTVLGFENARRLDIASADKYSHINLNHVSGVSVDYLQRHALYYHNYVMQPWLEIGLLTGCCRQPMDKAFYFLSQKIVSNSIGGEFLHSEAKIDGLRAQGGFTYATKGGSFNLDQAAPTIVMYYTLARIPPDLRLWGIQAQSKPSAKMIFLNVRRILWAP